MGKKAYFGPELTREMVSEMRVAIGMGISKSGVRKCDVLSMIEYLITGTYYFGDSPLRLLRKIFPAYIWRFEKIPVDVVKENSERLAEKRRAIVDSSDFLFLAKQSDIVDGIEWYVRARIKHEPHQSIQPPKKEFCYSEGNHTYRDEVFALGATADPFY